jgi:hypothetical protein
MTTLTSSFALHRFPALCLTFGLCASGLTTPAQADQVINDDLIVQRDLCVGAASCLDGQVFGENDIIIKSSIPQMQFFDTSSSAPAWSLRTNIAAGENFTVFNEEFNTTPFRIDNGVGTDNALRIDSDGNVGLGTDTPEGELHIVGGDSPRLRIEQDGADGFSPYTWDIAGNESAFFLRAVTAGATHPMRIRAGAPTNSLLVGPNGDVGLARGTGLNVTSDPDASLHILRSDGTAQLLIEDVGEANGNLSMMQLTNRSGRARMQFTSVGNASQTGDWSISSGLTFVLQERLNSKNVFIMDNEGNLAITGELTTAGSCSVGCDRVFDAEYDLPSIADHQAMMWQNGYLPNVGPTAEDAPFNVSDKMGRMLNELEHAHIFIGQQERRIEAQDSRIATLDTRNAAQESRIAALEAKLEALLAK